MAKQKGLTAVHKRRIRKLVDALRSGKYSQCKRQLHDGDSFCCLGVACDLYSKANHEPWEENYSSIPSFAGEAGTLPTKVAQYYGFDRVEHGREDCPENPSLIMKTNGDSRNAAALNDDYNYSFKRIATLFEKRFLKD